MSAVTYEVLPVPFERYDPERGTVLVTRACVLADQRGGYYFAHAWDPGTLVYRVTSLAGTGA